MLVKVSIDNIIIDQENRAIQENDIKIEDTKIIISRGAFIELEIIFGMIRKGFDDFKGNFTFRPK